MLLYTKKAGTSVVFCGVFIQKKKVRYSPQDIPGTDTFTDVFRI